MTRKNVEGETPRPAGEETQGRSSKLDPFVLEDVFPDVGDLFKSHVVKPVTDQSVLVALDTSAMLLPYKMSSGSLSALGDVYSRLAKESRLFVPARAAREFVKNRNNELGNLIQNLKVRKERLGDMPPILADLPGYKEAREAGKEVRRAYEQLETTVKSWRGNDPVTTLYEKAFPPSSFVDLPNDKESQDRALQELERRTRNLIPPGYKDAAKPDNGIGDLLIWLTLLKIGSASKKDMAFVTGEEKADWFNRSSGEHVYPRYELIDEYRRTSNGGGLRLLSLHQLLEEMKAPAEVVKDVRSAEKEDARRAAARAITPNLRIITLPEGVFVVPSTGVSAGTSNAAGVTASNSITAFANGGTMGALTGLTNVDFVQTKMNEVSALSRLFDEEPDTSKASDKSDEDDSE
jgi:hypothetical protein